MSEIVIRPATPDDLDDLIDVLVEVTAEERWLSTELPIDREHRRAIWLDHLTHEDRLMLVAADGPRAVGEIAVYQHPDYGPLIGMMLSRAYRGQGVGKQLLQGAIDWATRKGYPEIHLLVFAHNERARTLYERCGFTDVEFYPADVTRVNGEAWDTILMMRKLGGAS